VTNALGMAIESRRPAAGTLIYSDQGVQFTSWAFSQRVKASGLVPSMGGVGACYDNAMIESFWSRMQIELLDRRRWRTRQELANAIFEYVEVFHNRQRRHSSLAMLSQSSSRPASPPPWHEESSLPTPQTQRQTKAPVNLGQVNPPLNGLDGSVFLEVVNRRCSRNEQGGPRMPVPDEEHYQTVAAALADHRVVPLLGAGVNRVGRPTDTPWQLGLSLPDARELAAHLAQQFNYPTDQAAGLDRAMVGT
jgi:Integrase core domain